MNRAFLMAVSLTILGSSMAGAEYEVETNVVYGMYSGTALLMDVYRPNEQNGFGLIHISGSGWHAPDGYSATPLKES